MYRCRENKSICYIENAMVKYSFNYLIKHIIRFINGKLIVCRYVQTKTDITLNIGKHFVSNETLYVIITFCS